jgi:hypothetical protein
VFIFCLTRYNLSKTLKPRLDRSQQRRKQRIERHKLLTLQQYDLTMKSSGGPTCPSSPNPANMFANIMCSSIPNNNNNNTDSTDSDQLNDSSSTTHTTDTNYEESSLYIINNNNNFNTIFNSGMFITFLLLFYIIYCMLFVGILKLFLLFLENVLYG